MAEAEGTKERRHEGPDHRVLEVPLSDRDSSRGLEAKGRCALICTGKLETDGWISEVLLGPRGECGKADETTVTVMKLGPGL